ncbi:MAG: adenosylcobinamide-GDP ribazoletransferase [Bacteroidales bacterium]|nr:adenosylcobinamide-GDP ribazoletransferase [Bacteroidales bacterium]
MPKELKIFFTAVMFYTRIPVPAKTGYSPENLNKATRYFPLIGYIVGGVGALTFLLSNTIFSINISVLASLIVQILLTGAFHEDALSDFCDGFGGGYTKEKILTIMKDSRIGTYGAVALVMLLMSKFVLIRSFTPGKIPFIIITAHVISRLNTVFLIFTSKYVAEPDKSKSKPVGQKTSVKTLIIAILIGITPLFFVSLLQLAVIVFVEFLVLVYLRHYIHRHIGGYTGDVLGALQQFSEIALYLVMLIPYL